LKNAEQANIEIAQSISSVRQQLWRIRKNLSRELHGGLQAKLQVIALQIEKGVEVSPESLIEVQSALFSVKEPDRAIQVSINDFLEEQSEFWHGICAIEYTITPAVSMRIDSNVVINECIREVIREAINNAIKHAKSSNIEIGIELSVDSIINLLVTNSINQPTTASNDSSLGAKLFAELTDSWRIEYKVNSTELLATFKSNQLIN
jgi:nitrate/nitrite-specific signal transduction histidine kinase